MKIGIVAPPWLPVPPPAYGGTEAVIDSLAVGYTALGHDVRLFAAGDSRCPVSKGWVFPSGVTPMNDVAAECHHVQCAYEDLRACDVIHDHTVLGPAMAPPDVPVVVTMHGPMTKSVRMLCSRFPGNTNIVAISSSQRESAPELPIQDVIHHGVELTKISYGAGNGGYLLFLGRMSPNKGVHDAITIAQRAGIPLLIAAKMRESDEREYFRECVKPELSQSIQYVGEADEAEKFRLLGSALALVNPLQWPEPFGMVMIESLATGTPVISFRGGSPSEIVDHGRTGFLCASVEDAANAALLVPVIDRSVCRRTVAERFSASRMTQDYDSVFRRVLAHRTVTRHRMPLQATAS